MPLQDLAEFLDPTLRLPIRGKVYVVEVDAATGVQVQRLFNTATAAYAGADISAEDIAALELDDTEELDLYRRVLGPVYDEMLADGLPWVWIKHAGTTALMWIGLGMPAAEKFWSEAPAGEARRPATQDRKTPAKKSSTPRGTRSGSRAKPPASTNPSPDPLAETPSIS